MRIGYLPEERGVYPKATVSEQLIYLSMLKGLSWSNARYATNYWCNKFGLLNNINSPVEQLSKGNQQKVQLITSVINDPQLLIVDEPFSGLDPVNTEIIKEVLEDFIKKGTYIILSTHQMHTVEEFCKDILILDKGKTILQGDLREIKNNFGKSNFIIKTPNDITNLIPKDMVLLNKTVDTYEFKTSSEMQASNFLQILLKNNICIDKFEKKEPSLQEIFIKKVGAK